MMFAQMGAPPLTPEMTLRLPIEGSIVPGGAPVPGFQAVFEALETTRKGGPSLAEPEDIADALPSDATPSDEPHPDEMISDDAPARDMKSEPEGVPQAGRWPQVAQEPAPLPGTEPVFDSVPEPAQAGPEPIQGAPIPTHRVAHAAPRGQGRDTPEPMQQPVSRLARTRGTAQADGTMPAPSLSPMPPAASDTGARVSVPPDPLTPSATMPERAAAPMVAFQRAVPSGTNTAAHLSTKAARAPHNAAEPESAQPLLKGAHGVTDGDRPASAPPAPSAQTMPKPQAEPPSQAQPLPHAQSLLQSQVAPDTRAIPRDPVTVPPAPKSVPGAPIDPAITPPTRSETPRSAPRQAPRSIDALPPSHAPAAPASAPAFPLPAIKPVQNDPMVEPLRFVSDMGQNGDMRLAGDGVASLRASVEILHHPDLPRHVATQISAAVQRAIPFAGALGGAGGGAAGATAGGGEQAIELTLNPAELGRVRISMTPGDGAISVTVIAERPETLELMRRHADMLAQDFRHLGLGSAEFAFGRNPGQPGGTGTPDRAAHPEDSPPPTVAAAPAPTALGIAADRVDIRL